MPREHDHASTFVPKRSIMTEAARTSINKPTEQFHPEDNSTAVKRGDGNWYVWVPANGRPGYWKPAPPQIAKTFKEGY